MVPVGKKIFVALVIEPNKATLYMYDNGTLYSSSQNIVHDIEEFNGPLWIGRDPTQNRYFKGAIDDVRIYSTALNTLQRHGVNLAARQRFNTEQRSNWHRPGAGLNMGDGRFGGLQ